MSQRKLGACNLLTQAGFHTRGFDKANLNDERVVDRRREIPGRQWFDPMPNTFWERVQVKTDALLDRGKYTQYNGTSSL